jgi:hypothetical protein
MCGPFVVWRHLFGRLLHCGEKWGDQRIFCKFRAKIEFPWLLHEPSTLRTVMKKPLAAIASAIVLSCASGFTCGAAPLASADPAVVAATKEMFAAMKVRAMMANMMTQMEQQVPMQTRSSLTAAIEGNPTMTPQQKAEQLKKIDEAVQTSVTQAHALFSDSTLIDDMIAEMVPLYAETYTLDEIRQLTAFYDSPLGQKMQANAPALMSRSMQISQRVMIPRIQKAMAQSRQQAGVGK